jgi:hypothetical protein
MVAHFNAKIILAQLEVDIDNDNLKKKANSIRAIEAKIEEERKKKEVAEENLTNAKGKTLTKLKGEFDAIYGTGPSDTKKNIVGLKFCEWKVN